jgi:hypothetical protein
MNFLDRFKKSNKPSTSAQIYEDSERSASTEPLLNQPNTARQALEMRPEGMASESSRSPEPASSTTNTRAFTATSETPRLPVAASDDAEKPKVDSVEFHEKRSQLKEYRRNLATKISEQAFCKNGNIFDVARYERFGIDRKKPLKKLRCPGPERGTYCGERCTGWMSLTSLLKDWEKTNHKVLCMEQLPQKKLREEIKNAKFKEEP